MMRIPSECKFATVASALPVLVQLWYVWSELLAKTKKKQYDVVQYKSSLHFVKQYPGTLSQQDTPTI